MIRGLITSDLFRLSKILKKMELKINTSIGKTQEQVGAELILSAFENLHLAEKEVTDFFASLTDMTATEFAALPMDKTFEIIQEFKNIPDLTSFLKQANQ